MAVAVLAGGDRWRRLAGELDRRSGRCAPHGSRLYNRLAPRLLAPFYRRVADDVTAAGAAGMVLDVGSGPGDLALEIAQCQPRLTVMGVLGQGRTEQA